MSEVVCIGSLNVDLVFQVERMPVSGESVTGRNLERHLGGKGLNQALAATRAGCQVALVGAVGDDDGGTWMLGELADEGVDATGVERVDGPSGTALIEVDATGANRIVVIPGANGWVNADYTATQVSRLAPAAVALAPLEVPPQAVVGAIRAARAAGMTTILNPAPVPHDGVPEGLLELCDIVIPNEHEATSITGIDVHDVDTALQAGRALMDRGAGSAVVTLGARGAAWVTTSGTGHVPTYAVRAIDTVAAGDAFCGTLAASLAGGVEWERALQRACAAGALATTVVGASASLPRLADIEALIATGEVT